MNIILRTFIKKNKKIIVAYLEKNKKIIVAYLEKNKKIVVGYLEKNKKNIGTFVKKNKITIRIIIVSIVILFLLLIFLNYYSTKSKKRIYNLGQDQSKNVSEFSGESSINLSEKNIVDKEDQTSKQEDNNFSTKEKKFEKEVLTKLKNDELEKNAKFKKKKKIDNKKLDKTEPSALEIVDMLHNGLIDISSDQILNISEATDLIKKTYDANKMLSMIIGDEWNDVKLQSKKELISLFEEYIAKNYFKRFSRIKEFRFTFEDNKTISKEILLIRTSLIINKKDSVTIDYLLYRKNEKWKIFDILLDGAISEIATKKSEFRSFIKNKNIDPLIEALKEINNKLLN